MKYCVHCGKQLDETVKFCGYCGREVLPIDHEKSKKINIFEKNVSEIDTMHDESSIKMIRLECPNCHAPLQVNGDLKGGTCNYCGFHFLLDNEKKQIKLGPGDAERIGKAIEKANREAVLEKTRNDCERLRKIRKAFYQRKELEEKIKEKKEFIEGLKKKVIWNRRWNKFFASSFGEIAVIALPILFIIRRFISLISKQASFSGYLMALIMGCVIYLGLKLFSYVNRKKSPEMEEELDKKEKALGQLESELARLNSETDFSVIPSRYCNTASLDYLYQVLSRGKANSISQAIDVYEDALDRERARMIQEEQLDMQRRQMELQEEQYRHERQMMLEDQQEREREKGMNRAVSAIETAVTVGIALKTGKEILKNIKDFL